MNRIIINSEISNWGYSAEWLDWKLKNLTGDIEVVISSYGGDVFEGIAMFNQLKRYSKEKGKVTTIVNSHAMSIASLIFLAGDTKKAYDNSTIMIHKAWTWKSGNSDELKNEAEILESIDLVLAKEYKKCMNQDIDTILGIMTVEGWYIGKDRLIDTGFVDEFMDNDSSDDILEQNPNNFKKAMVRFSAEAIEKNSDINFENVKKAILECNDGKCPSNLVARDVPTQKVKPSNSKQENNMNITREDILASAVYKDISAENKKEIDGLNANLKEANSIIAKQKEWQNKLPEVCAMALERGVNASTLATMVMSGDMISAKAAIIDGMESDGAFGSKEVEIVDFREEDDKILLGNRRKDK